MYRLVGVYQGQIHEYRLQDRLIRIGRDPACTIVLDNPGVSRRHAVIKETPKGWVIADMGSRNGTFLNEERIPYKKKILLDPGDKLRIGDCTFSVMEEGEDLYGTTMAIREEELRPKQVAHQAFHAEDGPSGSQEETLLIQNVRTKLGTQRIIRERPTGPNLSVIDGKKYTLPVAITVGEFLIGRGEEATMKLRDQSVSSVHCKLVKRKGRVYLYDNNSLNGTFVNGERVRGVPLCDGDLILIGAHVIRFNDEGSPKTEADPDLTDRKIKALLRGETVEEKSPSAVGKLKQRAPLVAIGIIVILILLLLAKFLR